MRFVVIEGLDGSGKSTQIKRLCSYIENREIPYYYIHFPRTETGIFGNLISRFLRGEMGNNQTVDPYLVALLYAGDRKEAAEGIRNALKGNKLVLVDRYVFSNIAFQCAKFNRPEDQEKLQQWILELEYRQYDIPRPDINLFLDVPISFTREKLAGERKGTERKYLKGTTDIHETDIDFQQRVAQVYRSLVRSGDMVPVTCYDDNKHMLSEEQIFERILEALDHAGIW